MRNFSVYIAVLGFTILLSAGLPAEIVRNPDANTLWNEIFATPDDAKTWGGSMALKVADDRLMVIPDNVTDRCCMARPIEWDDDYCYLQFDYALGNPLGGYKGTCITGCAGSDGGYFPGLWTSNLKEFCPQHKHGEEFYLKAYVYGATLRFKFFRVVKDPEDGLLVTTEPKSKEILEAGDKIKFKAVLKDGAKDVTVTVLNTGLWKMGGINADGYVQLASEDKGRIWHGELTVGKGFGAAEIKSAGLIFQANVLGGKIDKMYTSNPWSIKP